MVSVDSIDIYNLLSTDTKNCFCSSEFCKDEFWPDRCHDNGCTEANWKVATCGDSPLVHSEGGFVQ
jgi:hypothetical protein